MILQTSTTYKDRTGVAMLVSHGFQSNYEAGFANGLAKNGIKVTLIASDQTLLDRLAPSIVALNLRGSQDAGRPAWRKAVNLIWYSIRLLGLIAVRRPVTHLTGLFLFSNFSSAWADQMPVWECHCLKLLSHRLILTVHNVIPHDRDTPALRHQLATVYRIPHYLVVHTAQMKQRLIDEFSVEPERILIMGLGLEEIVEPREEDITATRTAMGYTADQKLVLFLGWVRRYKGLDLLLEAARYLGDEVRVLIAGNCIDSDYQHEITQIIQRHALARKVYWEFGFLSEERVSALLGAADVLVMPYRAIDQSGLLFSALQHGVPVVAFDVGSFKDYLPEGTGLIVPAGNTVALATAIEEIFSARSARSHIHAVARKYRWQETVKPILHLYKN